MTHVTTRRFGAVLVGATAAAMIATLPPAAAAPLETGTFEDVFTFQQEDFCGVDGLDVDGAGVVTGRYRVGTKAGLPRGQQHLLLTRTVTNPETGLSVTDTSTVLEKDLRVTDNGDGTVTILVLSTGNATLYDDSTGTAIARNPGQVRFEIVIDLGGTPLDLSDDEFVEFLGLVKESTGRSDDYCAAAVAAIT